MCDKKLSLVVGSYEQLLICYELSAGSNAFVTAFGDKAQTGCIRAVRIAKNRKYLASASSDETVRIIDWKKRRQLGLLEAHSAPVLGIDFVGDNQLISAGADGRICIYNTSSWDIVHEWREAHKAQILSLAVHPTGKLVLSLSSDSTLRLWDLQRKKKAFSLKITTDRQTGRVLEVVWNPDASRYLLVYEFQMQLYDAKDCALVCQFPDGKKLEKMTPSTRLSTKISSAVVFLTSDLVLVGHESGKLCLISLKEGISALVCEKECHKSRIKAVQRIDGDVFSLVTCSSAGEIILWIAESNEIELGSLRQFAKIDTGVRITCLAVDGSFSLGPTGGTAGAGEKKSGDKLAKNGAIGAKSRKGTISMSSEPGESRLICACPAKKKRKIKPKIDGNDVVKDGDNVVDGNNEAGSSRKKKKRKLVKSD